MTSKPKSIFILKINVPATKDKYNIQDTSTEDTNTKTTNVSELNPDKQLNIDSVSFLDESKNIHTCKISMIDFHSKKTTHTLNYNCFWCRHPFDTMPIGCPINFIPSIAEKRYYSHISKTEHIIKESVIDHNLVDDSIKIKEANYYETDGIFCSFNCCKSFIVENKRNKTYEKSTTLLLNMCNEISDKKVLTIQPAPHWRMLEEYGGNLTIEKFRDSFNKIEFIPHGHMLQSMKFLSRSNLYEEIIQF